ncbi:MAG: 50S ribosomal protein L15 [Zetaproteobacteria bacterium]|nr:MAG: 50S ribosomal protein L15 [Zetaproteobacteria bacterium]
MKLNGIRANPGARHRRKRVGCGIGSGHGKTCGRGHKGQKSRTGGKIPAYFEGGQMPLVRRVPKRGFRSMREPVQVVNVRDLNRFEDGATVDREALKRAGLIKKLALPVKLLGEGELTKKLIVCVDAASQSARAKVEAAGGEIRIGAA